MTEDFTPYMDGQNCTAVVLGNDSSAEKILLAFPERGMQKIFSVFQAISQRSE